jgi:hypothetical protein
MTLRDACETYTDHVFPHPQMSTHSNHSRALPENRATTSGLQDKREFQRTGIAAPLVTTMES